MNEGRWAQRIAQFLRVLRHRYCFGSLPVPETDQLLRPGCSLFNFPFRSHSGPLDDVISDASHARLNVLVYVYCKENVTTYEVNRVLCSPSVAAEIEQGFMFYAADVTEPDGWAIAHRSKFHVMPMLILVQTCSAAARARVFAKIEGSIGEAGLLSYLTMIRGNGDLDLIQQQDEEFRMAVTEAAENEMRVMELEAMARDEQTNEDERRRQVEREFMNITRAKDKSEAVTIRFMFPNIGAQTRVFCESAPTTQVFAFARKFVFPNEFVLKTGFPLVDIVESDDPIRSISSDRQFIVHVEIVECDP